MTTFIQNAVFFILGIIQVSMVFFFLYKTVGVNPKFKIIHLIPVGLAVNVLVFIPVLFWPDAPWRPVWGLGLIISAAFFSFSGNIRDRLLYALIAMILIAFSDVISESAAAYIFSKTSIAPISLPYRAISFLIMLIFDLLAFSGIIHINTKGKLYLPAKYWVGAMASFSAVLVGYVILLNFEADTAQQRMLIVIGGFLLIMFTLVLYFAFYFVCRYFTKANEANIMAIQNEMIEKYILQKQESDKMIRVLSHDLRHNLLHWKQLAENNGYTDVLNGILEYERVYEANRLVDAGNDAANAIINQKLLMARKKEIQLDVKGIFSEGLSVTDIDLCSLLGNLLDNAIEACEKVNDAPKRKISLNIKRDGNFLFLEAVNSYETPPEVKDNRFITKKGSKFNHGIGMLSIHSVVEKYEGAIDNTFQNNEFRTVIMLRAYE